MASADHNIQQRKARHLDICLNPNEAIEYPSDPFQAIRLVHHALPNLDWDDIDLRTECLGHHVSRPFFISCMTGGSEAGLRVNKHLVQAAQQRGIAVGLGSMRVLFKHPELIDHFHVKPLAPDVPVWANLSAAQIRDIDHNTLIEWLTRLEVQALVLHCNAGQELFQPQGDRSFTGLITLIQQLCDRSPIPIIVKETGFGLRPQDVTNLTQAGVAAVDIAGAGGTNWIAVESQCHSDCDTQLAQAFLDWGNPTPVVLAAIEQKTIPILASGGLRHGVHIAKAIALGADLAGLALPFIQAEAKSGVEGVLALIDDLTQSLKTAMLLTGSKTIQDLQKADLILSESFIHQVRQYKTQTHWRDNL